MKNITSFIALFLMCFGISANAQLKHVGLDLSTKNGEPVVKVVDETGTAIAGATVNLVTSHGAHNLKKPVTKNLFVPDFNAKDMTADQFVTMTFAIAGLPAAPVFNTVDMDLHALNGSYAYQNNADGHRRLYSVEVLAGNDEAGLTTFGAPLLDFDIAAGVGAPKDVHQIWSMKQTPSFTAAGNSLVVRLLIKKGTENGGCFMGISKIELSEKNAADLEAEEAAKRFAAEKEKWSKLQGLVGFYSMEDVKTASKCANLEEAQAYLAQCAKIEFSLDEYYVLENVKRVGCVASVNAAAQQFAEKMDAANVDQLWQFVKVGENYTLVQANHGKSIAAPINSNGNWLTELVASDQALNLSMLALQEEAQYAFSFNTAEGVRFLGVGGAASNFVLGVNQEKVPNQLLENSDAAWYLRPIEQISVDIYPLDKQHANTIQDHWSSICLPFNAKCGNSNAGVKYYGVAEVGSSVAALKELSGVPAHEGVILYVNSKQTTYKFKIGKHATVEAAPVPFTNLLQGTNVVMPKTTDCLVLGNAPQGIGLYQPLAETLKANKAYLESKAAANGLRFVWGETTGVDAIAGNPDNEVVYDLSGRRVAHPAKGLYILNGKKVLFK